MRLFLAEKPSLARAIAEALPGPRKTEGQHIECANGDVVAWARGHILETQPPEHYNPAWKKWSLEHLPIVPAKWELEVKEQALYKHIAKLLKKAARVVHAGDPDREGQLLIDEILEQAGYTGPVDRIMIADTNLPAVKRELSNLKPNSLSRPLRDAALARQRADWLIGMNFTRLHTLRARQGGYRGESPLSVGRVQSSVLGLIVSRDIQIETFTAKPFFAIHGTVAVPGSTATFGVTWRPGESAAPHLDSERRLVSPEFTQSLVQRLSGRPGAVSKCSRERKTQAPPLPFKLSALQAECDRRLGLEPARVLEIVQALYETHKLTTYPRVDCEHLPLSQHPDAPAVLAAIKAHLPKLAGAVDVAIPSRRSPAWNDEKVQVHFAIIPTARSVPASLSDQERAVYELIARRYVAQFLPHFEYDATTIEISCEGEMFVATARQEASPGWKFIYPRDARDADGEDEETELPSSLPQLGEGSKVLLAKVEAIAKKTSPPKRFTNATLLATMNNVGPHLADPQLKKALVDLVDANGKREPLTLGTSATQATILETLEKRGYVTKSKRAITSTPLGRSLVAALPRELVQPDMTAVWELRMQKITRGELTLDEFLKKVTDQVVHLIVRGKGPAPAAGATKAA